MWLAATRPWNAVARELLLAWIAYCLSGIVACRNNYAGWLLCVVAAPGHGVVFERSYFCWRWEALLVLRLGRNTLRIKVIAFVDTTHAKYGLGVSDLPVDGPGRHEFPVTRIFTSA